MSTVNAEPTPDDSGRGSGSDAQAAGPVTAATDRLVATALTFDDAALVRPSSCPGWTRGHVLAHVARNADGLTNLLTWARTDQERLMYPSAESRSADIEAGAARPAADLVHDLRTSADRFAKAVMEMPEDGWERQVRTGAGGAGEQIPGRRILWLRLRELELHHVDLDAGYLPADWPGPFVNRALDETVRSFARRDDVPPVTVDVEGGLTEHLGTAGGVRVTGSAAAVLAWLTGRSEGHDLRVEPPGRPPALPAWL